MNRAKLREPLAAQGNSTRPSGVPLKPLRVSGIVVSKADLIEALRIYVSSIGDLQMTEDGEHFWLILREEECNEDSTAGQ